MNNRAYCHIVRLNGALCFKIGIDVVDQSTKRKQDSDCRIQNDQNNCCRIHQKLQIVTQIAVRDQTGNCFHIFDHCKLPGMSYFGKLQLIFGTDAFMIGKIVDDTLALIQFGLCFQRGMQHLVEIIVTAAVSAVIDHGIDRIHVQVIPGNLVNRVAFFFCVLIVPRNMLQLTEIIFTVGQRSPGAGNLTQETVPDPFFLADDLINDKADHCSDQNRIQQLHFLTHSFILRFLSFSFRADQLSLFDRTNEQLCFIIPFFSDIVNPCLFNLSKVIRSGSRSVTIPTLLIFQNTHQYHWRVPVPFSPDRTDLPSAGPLSDWT